MLSQADTRHVEVTEAQGKQQLWQSPLGFGVENSECKVGLFTKCLSLSHFWKENIQLGLGARACNLGDLERETARRWWAQDLPGLYRLHYLARSCLQVKKKKKHLKCSSLIYTMNTHERQGQRHTERDQEPTLSSWACVRQEVYTSKQHLGWGHPFGPYNHPALTAGTVCRLCSWDIKPPSPATAVSCS